MKKYLSAIFVIKTSIILLFPQSLWAWYSDPTINTPVAPISVNQIDLAAIPDGIGGAIVVWSQDTDSGSGEFDIYAQRMDSHGNPAWQTAVSICSALGIQGSPKIINDGNGGAVIVWSDSRNGEDNKDIFAQKISLDGIVQWTEDGIPIVTAPEWQNQASIVSDGAGGAIIGWDDRRNGQPQVYAQRIDGDGNSLWVDNGVQVVDLPYAQLGSDLISDGVGGAIFAWTDLRPINPSNISVQKLTSEGVRLWGDGGIAVCTKAGNQFDVHIVSDGFGGVILSWSDGRLGDEYLDIYSQRVDVNGTIMWQKDGVPLTLADGLQQENVIISDGVGGAIVVWPDGRRGNGDIDIYAQRIDAAGNTIWLANGLPIGATEEFQLRPVLISDDTGGAIIAWQDFFREGTSWNIFAQHVNADGDTEWKKDGLPVAAADESQDNPFIISDGAGGSIMFWSDARSTTSTNIYAQQVDRRGLLGGGEYRFYTADPEGKPKDIFTTGDLIQYFSSWIIQAPAEPGIYNAQSVIIINNGTDYRYVSIDYEVQ